MIELKHLRKSYRVGDFEQKALDDVSISFRDNEFVAVLGPSGSGKTTLLNILGGLDHADTGELIINGTSTKDYSSADWDTYRNHHIGFIFQSYNLIPHQTVLSNVELALTLTGVSREERRARAMAELERVGLAEQVEFSRYLCGVAFGGTDGRVDQVEGVGRDFAAAGRCGLCDDRRRRGRVTVTAGGDVRIERA